MSFEYNEKIAKEYRKTLKEIENIKSSFSV
jgi:hypothetical protein